MRPEPEQDRVLILDFGSQVTQLIARRVREAGVYSEIVPFDKAEAALGRLRAASAIILSGGPASVHETGTPRAPQAVFDAGVPVLGICYGEQAMVAALGGAVEGGHTASSAAPSSRSSTRRRCSRACARSASEAGVDEPWRPRHAAAARLPRRRHLEGAPFAAIADEARRSTACSSTPRWCTRRTARRCSRNFVAPHRRLRRRLDHGAVPRQRGRPHPRAGRRRAGDLRAVRRRRFRRRRGADPRGDRRPAHLHLRRPRADARRTRRKRSSSCSAAHYNIPLVAVDASALFLGELAGVTDPEVKRKTIGRLFIEVFEEEAEKLGGADFLAQGTLYPDVIESVSATGGPSVTIKSHHNVGGLPERMKHEAGRAAARAVQGRGARARAASSACPRSSSAAIPFPGPGPGHPHPRRGDARRRLRHAAQGGRHLPRGDPQAPGSTTRSGRPSPCCCRCAPSA